MFTLIIIGLLGLIAGSFVNALVWRVYQQELGAKGKQVSIGRGRSQCVNCGHQLAVKDLVPVLSWLWLRGRCRYCGQSISRQYPIVELLTALVFAASYVYWPGGVHTVADWLQLGTWLLSSVGLVALLVYDLRWLLLPNRILYPTLAIAVAGRLLYIGGFDSRPLRALGLWLASVAIASGFFWLLFQVSRGHWIGYGDVRLGLVTGTLLAQPQLAGLMIPIASVFGAVVILPLLISGRKHLTDKIPFGPFLIASTAFCLLWGQSLIDLYRNFLDQ